MSDRLMRKVVDKYAAKGLLPKISPHTLRHSCASHLLARGMRLHDLSRFLGHVLLATTTVYLHEVPSPVDMSTQFGAGGRVPQLGIRPHPARARPTDG